MILRVNDVGDYEVLVRELKKELRDCEALELGPYSSIFERDEYIFYKHLLEVEGLSVRKERDGWLSYNIIIEEKEEE